ncbi:MAG TPA: hypothetical protein VFX59_29380 [Polyangiales bacterium]|nr:hypothetical protein [Polyangiales bacterium]
MKRSLLAILISVATACGAEDTPGRRVEGTLSFATANAGTRSWALANGWTLRLEEAVVLLGPLYLRPPKRASSALSALFSRAHAHSQTLVDGDVMGEYLTQVAFDVLGPELSTGMLVSEAGPLDRLSIVLDAPQAPDAQSRAHGYHAYARGEATRGTERVAFACGMRIDASAPDMPKNLEARRRVDNVTVASALPMDDGAHLRVWLHPERWFEFVSFDDFRGLDNPCAQEGSSFALQWYLGLRRPDAFRAELN